MIQSSDAQMPLSRAEISMVIYAISMATALITEDLMPDVLDIIERRGNKKALNIVLSSVQLLMDVDVDQPFEVQEARTRAAIKAFAKLGLKFADADRAFSSFSQ